MKRLFASIVLGLILGSASAAASVLPSADVSQRRLNTYRDALLAKGKVATPDAQPSDTHVLFRTNQEALDWAMQVAPHLATQMDASRFDVLPLTDPRYATLQHYVDGIWTGYRELFPQETAGLNVPPVVLIDSEVVNAFVPKHIIQEGKIAHTVVVLTGLLDKIDGVENRDLLSGMFGHELAHSVFRHGLTEYQVRVNKFFNTTETRLGYQAVRSPDLDATVNSWVEGAVMAGDLTNEVLKDLPSQGIGRAIFMRAWNQLMTESFDDSLACVTAKQSFDSWSALQVPSTFASSYSLDLTDPDAVSRSSDTVASDAVTCLGDRRRPFVELLATVLGVPADALRGSPDIQQLAATFDAATNPIEGFRHIVMPVRASMVQIESTVPMGELGYFTYEEHADDISLIVHRALGWDEMSLANFFKLLLSPEDLARCEATIAAGETPPGGSFSDPHRATCYRIGHLVELNAVAATRDIRSFARDYVAQTIGE